MSSHNVMKLAQPATRWEDALPLGNGSIGALVAGRSADRAGPPIAYSPC